AIHLTNPKAVFFWGSVFAVTLPAGAGRGDIIALLAVCAGVSVTMLTAYALIFSTPRAMAFYGRARRWFDAGFAAIFGAAGVGVLLARI
ncbi:MAG: LysE family transporter, partial [Paracoccaceae bacterium]